MKGSHPGGLPFTPGRERNSLDTSRTDLLLGRFYAAHRAPLATLTLVQEASDGLLTQFIATLVSAAGAFLLDRRLSSVGNVTSIHRNLR
jgi:hypothetical protein